MISKRKLYIITFTLIMVILFSGYNQLSAATQTDTLNQYIADLQKNPNDTTLREKIIKHVQTMKQKPVIPEKAREHYVMAATFVEKAKDNSGYERAIEQYKAALLAAPWWADAYKKQAIVQKAAAHYDEAIVSLNLYILTQPADARDAQDEIYKLKALKQTATEDQSKKQKEEEQRDAPKRLVLQLKAQYEGATYAMKNCSHGPQSVCFEEVGMFPCGCNEVEFGGTNWYSGGRGVGTILFPNDGTILIYGDAKNPELKGTPKGPGAENIIWERSVVYSDRVEWKPIWVRLEGGLDKIMFSPGGAVDSRPVDDSMYQPQRRYYYRLFRKL
jgi:tetratricopeptide (TPR) repeat protein